jgi:Zn-dependent protease with chaperone function
MLFDLLFGFSTKSFLTNAQDYKKLKAYNEAFSEIFEDLKKRFNRPNVRLLIADSTQENAFAVGNMKHQYIIITKALISTYLMVCPKREDFLIAIKCVIGHEMSHLINKDYLPGLLLTMNGIATDFVSKIIVSFLGIFINIIQFIPFIGRMIAQAIIYFHQVLEFLISFFHKYIILSIYKFIQLKISRVGEFRCDMQSSEINGGIFMGKALSVLGETGYTTVFSTHPKTSDRVRHIQSIKNTEMIINPIVGNKIVNFLFITFILFLPFITYHFTDVKNLINNYNDIMSSIVFEINLIKNYIQIKLFKKTFF